MAIRRRWFLATRVLSKLREPIRSSTIFDATLADLIASVREQQLEGLVAKRRDSKYESGQRSGAWRKMRINQGQEFVIGGYKCGGKTFDALVFGCYEGNDLMYAARTRNGFTPKLQDELMKRFRPLETDVCPFVNLPEARGGRWGAGLTAAKMKECRRLKPELVGQFEFTEWTPAEVLLLSTRVGAVPSVDHGSVSGSRKPSFARCHARCLRGVIETHCPCCPSCDNNRQ
jgi:ATP-dependent DNA ligase